MCASTLTKIISCCSIIVCLTFVCDNLMERSAKFNTYLFCRLAPWMVGYCVRKYQEMCVFSVMFAVDVSIRFIIAFLWRLSFVVFCCLFSHLKFSPQNVAHYKYIFLTPSITSTNKHLIRQILFFSSHPR